jgi:hypothetical protein
VATADLSNVRLFATTSKGKLPFVPRFSDKKIRRRDNLSAGNQRAHSPHSVYIQNNKDDALRLVRTKTIALEEIPIGSWTPATWNDAVETICMWSEKGGNFYGSAEAVLTSFSLLDRALLEQKRCSSMEQRHAARRSLNIELLNSVIDSWSTCWISLQKPNLEAGMPYSVVEQKAKLLLELSVEDVLSRLDLYRVRSSGLITPDKNTYFLIKDAAAASYESGKRSRFALDLLDRMAKESEVPLGYSTYTAFIKTCAKFGDADQAEGCLEHMYHQFEKTGQKSLKPDTKFFNLVLLAWSQSSGDAKYASQRSQAILKRMQDLSGRGGKLENAVKPSFMSYSLVLKCMSKWVATLCLTSENAEKAKEYQYVGERAVELLREMYAGAARGDKMVRPNAVIYSLVLHSKF